MRALALIYSHRVPEFKETQIEFDPIQKKNPNPKRQRKTRLSVDRPCHGRPRRSTGPNREQPAFSRSTGPVDRSLSQSTGRSTVMILCTSCTPVNRAVTGLLQRSTESTIWPAQCAFSRSFDFRSLCYLVPSPLSPHSLHSLFYSF